MARTIHIAPITRIEGHGSIAIQLDDDGNVAGSKVHYMSLRGFEKFIEGKPAEEVPRIVNRICGICPWHHHMASNKAVDRCFGVTPPPAGNKLREFAQIVSHAEDKLLHFYFLAAPDFVMGPDVDYGVRNVIGIVKVAPELATKAVQARYKAKMILEKLGGKAIHPHAGVAGGFCRALLESERREFLEQLKELLEFSVFTLDFAKKEVFPKYLDIVKVLGVFEGGFLGTVDEKGQLNFYDGKLRMMKPDGTYTDFDTRDYANYLGEAVVPFSYGKFPYAKFWGEGFSMDLDNIKGVYRSNCLARINVCDSISTPRAQAELEEFRKLFGRPAQLTLLYHWARLIEDVYAYEHAIELL
ncbi:MAG: Ni/Fe hydrogenase subunit alpha, partial [Syntrophobacteraceae bacterium]